MRFVPNPKAFQEIRRQPSFDAGMEARAKVVKELAEHFTSRGSDERRGHFADKFVLWRADGVPIVGNTDKSFYHLLEFGSVNNRAQAPLRRAVRAAGLRLELSPKK